MPKPKHEASKRRKEKPDFAQSAFSVFQKATGAKARQIASRLGDYLVRVDPAPDAFKPNGVANVTLQRAV